MDPTGQLDEIKKLTTIIFCHKKVQNLYLALQLCYQYDSFLYSLKTSELFGFLTFSGGVEMEYCTKMGECT